jgi:parallel beta-helix repeat protein
MKKILFFLTVLYYQASAQTVVSGGVFSNTTWTEANSPYIVTGNVVVFQGATLTIQPGVTIKFDEAKSLEIRQSTLIAEGTASKPIVFTSNQSNPASASWEKVYATQGLKLKMNHCKFSYAGIGISGPYDSITVLNCTFSQNRIGIDAVSDKYIRIDSCTFRGNYIGQILQGYAPVIRNSAFLNNETGISAQTTVNIIDCIIDSNSVCGLLKRMGCYDTIRGNKIRYNAVGIGNAMVNCNGISYIHNNSIEKNASGIKFQQLTDIKEIKFYDNNICSNSKYSFENLSTSNINASINCWCENNQSHIEASIYDAYDNVKYGIVKFDPFKTESCPIFTDISSEAVNAIYFYPNPVNDKLTIETNFGSEHTIDLFDINGKKVYSGSLVNKLVVDVANLTGGVYALIINTGSNLIKKRVVIAH